MNLLATGTHNFRRTFWLTVLLGFGLTGCSHVDQPQPPTTTPALLERRLIPTGYTIQAGAFANLDNAVRFTEALKQQGIDAYHFIDDSGLFKVRFGNYSTRRQALSLAYRLQDRGTISDFFIVSPQQLPGKPALRERLVKTAEKFLGIPYKWGGESPREGFDCSGLTMTVYQLNGLDLPRSSRQQWQVGIPVNRRELKQGDLVFFATSGGRRVSHVGLYAGNNRFIHAPGSGRKIRTATLTNRYYKRHYVGARRYI